MKVAIVHEWFTTIAGSERVVEQMLALYPGADVFAVYADPDLVAQTDFLRGRNVRTTFIQHLPRAKTAFRSYLGLMPLAIEQLDLSAYDLILSSSHAVSKGVLTGPNQLHISYVHSPIRYAWDLQHQYLRESGLDRGLKGWIAKWTLHKIRQWDQRTAAGVDHFVANSRYIGRRIRKVYRRDSDVIYPPVAVQHFALREAKEDFYLAASRLVPYKRMDLIVQAFVGMPDKRLVVIGDGPEMPKLKAAAKSNIELMGYQPFDVLRDHMQRAKAFVFAAEEDFGITPVEAQACGTPVIAFGRGGALETIIDATADTEDGTGVFFDHQTPAAIQNAVHAFETMPPFKPIACRVNAERFSLAHFREAFEDYVNKRWQAFDAEVRASRANS